MLSPGRLALARRRRGLTQAELGRRVGALAGRISDYERGRLQPTEAMLRTLAAELDFPPSFLVDAEPSEIPLEAVSFRAQKKLPTAKRQAAVAGVALAVELNTWLEQRFRLPANTISTLDEHVSPETAAEMVRAEWGMGTSPVSNVVRLLESRGARVFAVPLDYVEVDAFSLWHTGRPFVFLNTLTTGERGRFDAAHELGHLVLHAGAADLPSQLAERQANAFASAFLMPSSSVFAHMPREPLTSQIIQAKRIWKVSAMALAHRLHDLGLLDEDHYKTACVELSRQGYRTDEPDGINRESSLLLTKALRSLRRQRISLADVANELHIPAGELTALLHGLATTAVSGVSAQALRSNATHTKPPMLTVVPSGARHDSEPAR